MADKVPKYLGADFQQGVCAGCINMAGAKVLRCVEVQRRRCEVRGDAEMVQGCTCRGEDAEVPQMQR